MTRQMFAKALEKHFKISHGDAHKFIDLLMLRLRMKCTLDIMKFDDWLHEQHGEYEEAGQSMSDVITLYYGKTATAWVKRQIGGGQ